jgi:hypothetical protein
MSRSLIINLLINVLFARFSTAYPFPYSSLEISTPPLWWEEKQFSPSGGSSIYISLWDSSVKNISLLFPTELFINHLYQYGCTYYFMLES